MIKTIRDIRPAVLGLGYVGLPVLVAVSGSYEDVYGFDINDKRVEALKNNFDWTGEVSKDALAERQNIKIFSDIESLQSRNFFVVTVPTPIDSDKKPDFGPLKDGAAKVASILKKGDIVVFESTVYPGATREISIPILESVSGLVLNEDFYVGYSPERINPGDLERPLPNIVKVTSGSNSYSSKLVDEFYSSFIKAGTHRASSIEVAEAAKVIENTQRDLNIALINELSMIFAKLEIDTREVLAAAKTKWNFLPFEPGLVGGHCIGVDPYYLTYKAQEIGHIPEVILAGRKINDEMAAHAANKLLDNMVEKGIALRSSKILVMGFTFKQNCRDIRNTKVADLVANIMPHVGKIDIFDPYADPAEVKSIYDLEIESSIGNGYDAILIAVGHDEFYRYPAEELRSRCNQSSVLFDLQGVLPQELSDIRL